MEIRDVFLQYFLHLSAQSSLQMPLKVLPIYEYQHYFHFQTFFSIYVSICSILLKFVSKKCNYTLIPCFSHISLRGHLVQSHLANSHYLPTISLVFFKNGAWNELYSTNISVFQSVSLAIPCVKLWKTDKWIS